MESRWRREVAKIGLSDVSAWLWGPEIRPNMRVELAAELITPFTYFGHTYTHVVLATQGPGRRIWNVISLLGDPPFYTAFLWVVAPKGWPYGTAVVPD